MSRKGRSSRNATAIVCAVLSFIGCASHAQTADDLSGLPLAWLAPPGTPDKRVVVLMSGDGGFADLVTHVANAFQKRGLAVVSFNSRSWLSTRKTPEETAQAIARVAHSALTRWHGDSLILVGYSRGADFAPFVANRLPADLRQKLSAVAMFGLAPMANFEFHWSDLVKDTPRESDVPTLPEIRKLHGLPMVCVYGSEEEVSGCRSAPDSVMRKEMRKGGHHFDGDATALVDIVMQLFTRTAMPGAGNR